MSIFIHHIHIYFLYFSTESKVTREDIIENNTIKSSNDQACKYLVYHKGTKNQRGTNFPLVKGDFFFCNIYNLVGFYFAVLCLFCCHLYTVIYLYIFLLKWHQQYMSYIEYQRFLHQSCAKTATFLLKVSKYPHGCQWAALSFIDPRCI